MAKENINVSKKMFTALYKENKNPSNVGKVSWLRCENIDQKPLKNLPTSLSLLSITTPKPNQASYHRV